MTYWWIWTDPAFMRRLQQMPVFPVFIVRSLPGGAGSWAAQRNNNIAITIAPS